MVEETTGRQASRAVENQASDQELLWKRAVRREIESARREPRNCNLRQACELSAFVIDNLRRTRAMGEQISEAEIDRRVALYHARVDEMERRVAATWRQVLVAVRQ